jgi:hypothetical protein
MPIRLDEEKGGKIIVVHVSGKLVKADYEQWVPEFDRLAGKHEKIRLLFDMVDFHGWDAGAAWEDLKLDVRYFDDFERIAMVGDEKWQEVMATVFKPFTKAAVRYFDHANAAEARNWLVEA